MTLASVCTTILLALTSPTGQVTTEQGYTCTQAVPASVCTQSVTMVKGGRVSHVCTKRGPAPKATP